MIATVRPSELADVEHLRTRLRAADLVELSANGVGTWAALYAGLQLSAPNCWTIDSTEPVGMFGVVPTGDGLGAVWLLGSDKLLTIRRQFLRECRAWLTDIGRDYVGLFNQVHQDNLVHIRWLRWMGFTFIRHKPPFIEFAKLCATP